MPSVTGALAQKDIPVCKPTSMTAMKSFLVTAPRPALATPIIMVIWAPDALEYAVGTRFPKKAVRALVARAGAVLLSRPIALPRVTVQRGVPDTKSQKSVPYYIYYVLRGVPRHKFSKVSE